MAEETAQMGPDWAEEMEAIATKRPIFTVYEGGCYWSMPDGSNRCITGSDAKMINDALKETGAFALKAARRWTDEQRFVWLEQQAYPHGVHRSARAT